MPSNRPDKPVGAPKRAIDFELAKAKNIWFREAKKRGWDDDIRDCGWRMIKLSLLAARARRGKVRKHDDARTLLRGSQ